MLLGFNGFYLLFFRVPRGFTGFYWVLMGFTCFFPSSTWFYWVLLGFTGFYWVLLGLRLGKKKPKLGQVAAFSALPLTDFLSEQEKLRETKAESFLSFGHFCFWVSHGLSAL